MRLGYHTAGLIHHSLPAAIDVLACLGYESVAITVDHARLNPYDPRHEQQLAEVDALLKRYGMRSVIETNAPYLLDPMHKHQPTLVSARSAGRPRRVEFLRHAIDTAASLGSDCVSLTSGALPANEPRELGMRRLQEGLHAVLDYAERRHVALALEPEQDMLIGDTDQFAELFAQFEAPHLGLTLDIGNLHSNGETPIPRVIDRWKERIFNVHVADALAGVRRRLVLGQGEIDFPPILSALVEAGFAGGLHVELIQDSEAGPQAAQRAYSFLHPLVESRG